MAGDLQTAFGLAPIWDAIKNPSSMSVLGMLSGGRPAKGNFAKGPSSGVEADPTGGGWDAKWNTAFAHPNNRARRGVGSALMGFAPMLAGQNSGGFGAFSGILPSLMQQRDAGEKNPLGKLGMGAGLPWWQNPQVLEMLKKRGVPDEMMRPPGAFGAAPAA